MVAKVTRKKIVQTVLLRAVLSGEDASCKRTKFLLLTNWKRNGAVEKYKAAFSFSVFFFGM